MAYKDPGARWVIDRATIRMPYLPDELADLDRSTIATPSFDPHTTLVTARSHLRLRKIAEQVGRQFHRETRFDFPPYSAREPHGDVVLLHSQQFLICGGELVAGAVGAVVEDGQPWARWAYVHPYERGRGLVERAWPWITSRWPGIRPEGPFTPAGAQLRNRLEASMQVSP